MKKWCDKWTLSWLHIIYLAGLFLLLSVFYTRIHPLLVVDGDDWRYISVIRSGLPIWKHWNPAKVFVETFTGFVGYISAFVVYPVTHDYLSAFTLTYGTLTALFIVIYLYCFDLMLIKKMKLEISSALFVSLLFFSAHFLILKSQPENNVYMLSAFNLNCFAAYVWAFLLNASVAFCFVAFDFPQIFCRQGHDLKKGLILCSIYLAIFSNMVDTIVLFSVVFCSFFLSCLDELKRGKGKRHFRWKECSLYFYVFALQAICMFFEANGGRAESLTFKPQKAIRNTVSDVKDILSGVNKPFFSVCVLVVVAAVAVALMEKRKKGRQDRGVAISDFGSLLFVYGCSFLMCVVYILGLLTRMGQHKIKRSENLCVAFVYGAVLVAVCVAYLIKRFSKARLFLPILCYVLVFWVLCSPVGYTGNGHIYKRSHAYGQSVHARKAVAQGIVDQFIQADEAGLEHVAVHVDTISGKQDWAASCWADTLYAHGIISRRITAEVVPDPAIDQVYHMVSGE